MNKKELKAFLELYQYGLDDCKKKEAIPYILKTMEEAETKNKILSFDKLGEIEYSPNPFISNKGNLIINTFQLNKMFEEYQEKIKYVQTEIALLIESNYKVMNSIIENPIED